LKFWILALGAAAVIAARATYNFVNRPARTGRFTDDQVSSDWLATARIHEDQG
jgi:peptidoglycan/LPS O-acetylase OafA/YrhL